MSIKSFDPFLRRWFQADTRETLHAIMNHPAIVHRRLIAVAQRREAGELNARHEARFKADAHSKRIHQNAKRLAARRKGGFPNNSFAIIGGPYLFTNERQAAA